MGYFVRDPQREQVRRQAEAAGLRIGPAREVLEADEDDAASRHDQLARVRRTDPDREIQVHGAVRLERVERAAQRVFRDLHLNDFRWRLDHGTQRERTLLQLAQRATWQWSKEVPAAASHAVLVVEDEDTVRKLTAQALRKYGYTRREFLGLTLADVPVRVTYESARSSVKLIRSGRNMAADVIRMAARRAAGCYSPARLRASAARAQTPPRLPQSKESAR